MNIVKYKTLDSVIKTVLIILCMYVLAFALVQGGYRRLRTPPVAADKDGAIFLRAADVEIMGRGPARLHRHAGQESIGWWNDPAQWLQARFKPGRSGEYMAELFYSLPAGRRSRFVLELSGQDYEFEVGGKGSWGAWQRAELGTVTLESTGTTVMAIRSVETLGGRDIMNFCWLKLTPR